MKRFELRPSPWQGDALPLSYIRDSNVPVRPYYCDAQTNPLSRRGSGADVGKLQRARKTGLEAGVVTVGHPKNRKVESI